MRRVVYVGAACGSLFISWWCARPGGAVETPAGAAGAGPTPAQVRGTIRSIALPEDEPELPPAPGRDAAQAFCATCHTTRYITNQPPLSRETWLAEVTKMRKVYSGPIPEDKVGEIVDYLAAVRGPAAK